MQNIDASSREVWAYFGGSLSNFVGLNLAAPGVFRADLRQDYHERKGVMRHPSYLGWISCGSLRLFWLIIGLVERAWTHAAKEQPLRDITSGNRLQARFAGCFGWERIAKGR
jgi:hypothetical protein